MAGERYTQEFKIAAVQQITQEGHSIPEHVKLTALEILFSKFSSLYEAVERSLNSEQQEQSKIKFNAMPSILKSYAAKKRLQAQFNKREKETH